MTTRKVAAGAFKQGCLALLDEVAGGNVQIVVTKRGRPVARLVSAERPRSRESAVLATLRARTRVLVGEKELLQPSSRLARWRALPKPASR